MSVRLFVGYFLALAACATIAFASSDADPSAPPVTAEADMLPMPSFPAASFYTHSRKIVLKRTRIAEAR